MRAPEPLSTEQLRWRCDASTLGFETTEQVEPAAGVIGQDEAVEALRFGLRIEAPGQNVFVRGLAGTGRQTLVRSLLAELPNARDRFDLAYVHNFDDPDRPRLLELPSGTGPGLRNAMEDFAHFVEHELAERLAESGLAHEQVLRRAEGADALKALTGSFDREISEAGFAIVLQEDGDTQISRIVPVLEDQPIPPEALPQLVAQGAITQEEADRIGTELDQWVARYHEVQVQGAALQRRQLESARKALETAARNMLGAYSALGGDHPAAQAFVKACIEDVVTRRLPLLGSDETDFVQAYSINLIVARDPDAAAPAIVETLPTVQALLGSVGPPSLPFGYGAGAHHHISAGALVRASGGTLILDAADLLSEPAAYAALTRCLRSGHVSLAPGDDATTLRAPGLHPQAIPIDTKVVLIGDAAVYYALDENDRDFPELFKVLADFDDTMSRTTGVPIYAAALARLSRIEGLPHFHATAVAALAEHGARVASEADVLTARIGRVADLAREAAFLADGLVEGTHVREAVRRTKQRADLPGRSYREQIASGRVRVHTEGARIGEINGLATMQAGPLTYGFPTRITATVAPGTGGTVNIEGEAQLSGNIHTKAFHIVNGLLRRLLRPDHPLAFDASVAFEQVYGGVDGDSASCAAFLSLLSALTGLPLRQDLAITGAVDQVGNVLPIGAVNEKIEGFFDVCRGCDTLSSHGCVVPIGNAGDLMLRSDVVEACERGCFRVYAITDIHEAIALFFEPGAGEPNEAGAYPTDSVLGVAQARARQFWQAAQRP